MNARWPAATVALVAYGLLFGLALLAPEHLSPQNPELAGAGPLQLPPFGADERGRPLLEYAAQGASVLALPALIAGMLVGAFATLGGLVRAMGLGWVDPVLQGFGEVVGALPRMVVVLVVALVLPSDMRGLLPLAVTWALLSAPGAMDEAASVAERLGGARFVEALRAHGYSAPRIFLYHVVALNLRPVIVRQAAETTLAVMFLEIALSYLAIADAEPSFTHADSLRSWADILYLGYQAAAFDLPYHHALVLGLGLLGVMAVSTVALGRAARSR
jgi:ABC-type dipeptide/oligopeptide/nickel transport system permease subunit